LCALRLVQNPPDLNHDLNKALSDYRIQEIISLVYKKAFVMPISRNQYRKESRFHTDCVQILSVHERNLLVDLAVPSSAVHSPVPGKHAVNPISPSRALTASLNKQAARADSEGRDVDAKSFMAVNQAGTKMTGRRTYETKLSGLLSGQKADETRPAARDFEVETSVEKRVCSTATDELLVAERIARAAQRARAGGQTDVFTPSSLPLTGPEVRLVSETSTATATHSNPGSQARRANSINAKTALMESRIFSQKNAKNPRAVPSRAKSLQLSEVGVW
jgi:hypothetical protein